VQRARYAQSAKTGRTLRDILTPAFQFFTPGRNLPWHSSLTVPVGAGQSAGCGCTPPCLASPWMPPPGPAGGGRREGVVTWPCTGRVGLLPPDAGYGELADQARLDARRSLPGVADRSD
jgi:hypothetical protein